MLTGMATTTIGCAVADEGRDRLDRLVEHFGAGNRSAFLRAALASWKPWPARAGFVRCRHATPNGSLRPGSTGMPC